MIAAVSISSPSRRYLHLCALSHVMNRVNIAFYLNVVNIPTMRSAFNIHVPPLKAIINNEIFKSLSNNRKDCDDNYWNFQLLTNRIFIIEKYSLTILSLLLIGLKIIDTFVSHLNNFLYK